MKKTLAILFAALILLSGMHLTMGAHLCGGSLAAVKWSFTGATATCGMESDQAGTHSGSPLYSSHCCDDEVSACVVDGLYQDSDFSWKSVSGVDASAFLPPVSVSSQEISPAITLCSLYTPPDIPSVGEVRLDDICVFRI